MAKKGFNKKLLIFGLSSISLTLILLGLADLINAINSITTRHVIFASILSIITSSIIAFGSGNKFNRIGKILGVVTGIIVTWMWINLEDFGLWKKIVGEECTPTQSIFQENNPAFTCGASIDNMVYWILLLLIFVIIGFIIGHIIDKKR